MQLYYGSAEEVVAWENHYHGKWWGKSSFFWLRSLFEEFVELGLSLVHLHKHTPDLELMEIASICIGWMDYRKSIGIADKRSR